MQKCNKRAYNKLYEIINPWPKIGVMLILSFMGGKREIWFRPGSNRGPFACKANVITTTLRNLNKFTVRRFFIPVNNQFQKIVSSMMM